MRLESAHRYSGARCRISASRHPDAGFRASPQSMFFLVLEFRASRFAATRNCDCV
jgi:hypothetical protein